MYFLFHDAAPTEIYTLSLHDALPIFSPGSAGGCARIGPPRGTGTKPYWLLFPPGFSSAAVSSSSSSSSSLVIRSASRAAFRSEEHTSELQSLTNLVCRLLLEKKKKRT